MNDHVVSYYSTGHPEATVALLLAHPYGQPEEWRLDGVTAEPNMPCSAISLTSGERCGKREAVVVLAARAMYSIKGVPSIELYLCGGHYNSHRAGREVRVIVADRM